LGGRGRPRYAHSLFYVADAFLRRLAYWRPGCWLFIPGIFALAKGYSLMVCPVPIVLYFWVRAIHENRWRWWLHSASEFAFVYCYPGSLYVLIVLMRDP
jgi:hypothetical protein